MYKVIGNGHEMEVNEKRLILLAGFHHICMTAKSRDFTLEEAIDYLEENNIEVQVKLI